jgi:hypothetical protein
MVTRFLRRPRTRGQALVELAIILPVLLLVVLMALDLGRVFFGWVGLNNAARIGASYAAAHPTAWVPPGDLLQQGNYEDQIRADADALNCALPGVPDPVFPSGTALGQPAQVTLTCDFSLLTPLVSQIIGGSITIRAESIFPIRTGMIGGVPAGPGLPSPNPSPSPSGSAGPSPSGAPTPTPTPCVVPNFIGDSVGTRQNPNPAIQAEWGQAGFTTQVTINRQGQGNASFVIGSQSLISGQPAPCGASITVGP